MGDELNEFPLSYRNTVQYQPRVGVHPLARSEYSRVRVSTRNARVLATRKTRKSRVIASGNLLANCESLRVSFYSQRLASFEQRLFMVESNGKLQLL